MNTYNMCFYVDMCGYSLESNHRCDSNEYSQHVFFYGELKKMSFNDHQIPLSVLLDHVPMFISSVRRKAGL